MAPPIISHVFIGDRLVIKKVRLRVESQKIMVDELNGREHIFDQLDMDRLDFGFHESGPSTMSRFETFAILRFSKSQLLCDVPLTPNDPIIFIFSSAYEDFSAVQKLVVMYQRLLTPIAVNLLPFSSFPECVKAVIPQVAQFFSNGLEERIAKENMVVEQKKDNCICLDSDDDEPTSSFQRAAYYLIENEKIEITPAGIKSLDDGSYLNDEIMNIAIGRLAKKHPQIHFFRTYESSKIFKTFEKKEYRDNFEMTEMAFDRTFGTIFKKIKDKKEEHFLKKKMLIFPICHVKHWFIIVVVNPLLADVLTMEKDETAKKEGHRFAAYYIDSLKGTRKYSTDMLVYRMRLTWKCVFSFLRLTALYHFYSHLNFKLTRCAMDENIPHQTNNSDCGPHSIINSQFMAEYYDEMIKGPAKLRISDGKVREMRTEVNSFREEFRQYLLRCKE